MITVKIADVAVGLEFRYETNRKFFKDYLCDGEPQFIAACSDEEIDAELTVSEIPIRDYCENACLCRNVAEKIIDFDSFLFHSAVVEVDGKAVAFAAKSGVGKSTHVRLWQKNFKDCRILNGDKPFFNVNGDKITVYGSPWRGKEGIGYNGKAELCGICFLTRAEKNSARKMTPEEAFSKMFLQISFPKELEHKIKITELLHTLSRKVPCYELFCNMNDDAAFTARGVFDL